MKPQECIFFQLAKGSQNAIRFWTKKISHLNVTAVQGMVLNFLADEDRITSRELGEMSQLDSATLTGIIDRLEEAELIERRPKPGDRRAILICLTGKGRELADELRKLMIKANREFLFMLSDKEEKTLRSLLKKIRTDYFAQ